ncbi:hypothetical protein GBA52_028758 [Prunus armeniaca]|nr:hypothetical protein GBA52_028758 [Prunus armeniaca]
MDSSSSQFGGCGHTCANSGNGYKGEIERKLYPTRDGRKLPPRHGRRVGSSVVAGELLVRRPKDKLLKQTGGRIDPFSIIPKKDCWQQVLTFILLLQKEMRAGLSSAEG